jgi:UDP-N-acetylmuramate--alanine ligase
MTQAENARLRTNRISEGGFRTGDSNRGGKGAPVPGIAAGGPPPQFTVIHPPSEPSAIKAAHRYEVVEAMNRLKIVGGRFHFIGAGGVGMSGLAQFLIGKKAIVTGSDQAAGAVTTRLNGMGAQIHIGHSEENLHPATEVVVISAAIREDNPELKAARRQGCRIYKYAQFLGELVCHFDGIAIAGTHGKSTTSGWLAYCLRQVGVDANFVVGAEVLQLGGSCGSGDSDFFVVEACEYDRSFHNLKPLVTCILNIERDHLDCYKDEDDIIDSFYLFALGTHPDGLLVADGDDPNVAKVLERLRDDGSEVPSGPLGHLGYLGPITPTPAIMTFGFDERCDFSARNVREDAGFYRFDVFRGEQNLGPAAISLPGRHNVHNALAVVALASSLGVEPERVLEVLGDFEGMDRRLMLKGRLNGITVLDDYAHHPTEIRASLQAIRERYRPGRLWCVFQAHQYSRTQLLLDEFAPSFACADKVIVPEIYFVRDSEASRRAVNARILAERIRNRGTDAEHIGTFTAICDYLEQHVRAGDVVVAMGAGDVWKVADEYIQRLGRDC